MIKLDNNHMLNSFSNILQSSLTEFAIQFKIYMLQASASGVKFLLKSSSQTYPSHTQNKLLSSLKHTPNIPIILLRVVFGKKFMEWHAQCFSKKYFRNEVYLLQEILGMLRSDVNQNARNVLKGKHN